MLKVFIADDDDIIRQGLRIIVEKYASECQVVGEAADGERALEALKDQQVDLLITDIKMPIMEGTELIKRMREMGIQTKVIVLSGFDEYKFVREAMRNGAVDYLLKPIQKRTLIELIEKIKEDINTQIKIESQNRLLQCKVDETLHLIKEKYLENLIKGNYSSISEYEDKLGDSGILRASSYLIASICIDNYFKLKNINNENLNILPIDIVRNNIKTIIEENSILGTLISIQESQITVLFTCNEVTEDFADYVIDMLNTIKNAIKERFNFTITTGVSKIFESLERVHIAYHQATFALERRFYENGDSIIIYDASKCCYDNVSERDYEERINEIMAHIELGYSKKLAKSLGELFNDLKQFNISPGDFKDIISRLVHRIVSLSYEFKDALNECYITDENDMFFYVKEISTLNDLQDYLADMFTKVVEKMNLIRAEKSKKIIEIAKDYIMKHFSENINLNTLAEQVYLNPTYFCSLFKNETGKNFSDFLLEVRINAAKKLLAKPEIMVYEVGQMVGYEEPVSFGRAFKKVVGVSPAEYRKIIK